MRSIVEGLTKYFSSMTTSIREIWNGVHHASDSPRYVALNGVGLNAGASFPSFGHITGSGTKVRQHEAGGGADSGRRDEEEDAGVFGVAVALPVPRAVREARQGKR